MCDIGLDDDPAAKAGTSQDLEDGREVNRPLAQFSPDPFGAKGRVIPGGGDACGQHLGIDIFDMDRLNAGGVVATELDHIGPGPGQVTGIRPHEDDVAIDQIPQSVDLFTRLNRAADVVVETALNPLCQCDLAHRVEGFGKLGIFGSGHPVFRADVAGDLAAGEAAAGGVTGKATGSDIEFSEPRRVRKGSLGACPLQDRLFLGLVPIISTKVTRGRFQPQFGIGGENFGSGLPLLWAGRGPGITGLGNFGQHLLGSHTTPGNLATANQYIFHNVSSSRWSIFFTIKMRKLPTVPG